MSPSEPPVSKQIRALEQRARQRIAHLLALPDFSDESSSSLRSAVQTEGALSSGYMLMCVLSSGIATLGLLQSSVAVVIGAMLVSPLMNPIAALGFGFASLDGHRIRDAVRVVVIGAAIGVSTALLLTWVSPIDNATPEIIARTQPTLLDLAIALLSGVAGGYATVRQKGGTAIGVAIATALMPPLATVGYGIGVGNWEFARGAFLLFLTNLAAISFAVASIARLSGVARPLSHVELTPRYIAIGLVAFVALATPLGTTLVRVSKETRARSTSRSIITNELKIAPGKIAQLEVRWPLFGQLAIDAVVIESVFLPNASERIEQQLRNAFGVSPSVSLQQIVAGDNAAQARALVDAAIERNSAGIVKDVPPYELIQRKVGLPVSSIWADRSAHVAYVAPVDAPTWTLADYRTLEVAGDSSIGAWHVRIIPPATRTLIVSFPSGSATASAETQLSRDVATWALQRWSTTTVWLQAHAPKGNKAASEVAAARLSLVASWLAVAHVAVTTSVIESGATASDDVTISVVPPSPSQLRLQTPVAKPPDTPR